MPPSAQQHKCRSIRNSHSKIKAMVVPAAAAPECREAAAVAAVFSRRGIVVPTVDMSAPAGRGELSRQMVRACAESGFFKAVNHGVPPRVAATLDAAAAAFFAQAAPEKQLAGPPDPLGYGSRSIGTNGDVGELEYLILHTNSDAVARKANAIDREDPRRFSQVVNDYVEAVRQLACHVLDLLGEGLGLRDPTSLTRLITATDNDSLLRINHYPPSCATATRCAGGGGEPKSGGATTTTIGFGEHTDPQIVSVLRANDVNGLQLLLQPGTAAGDDVWVPVPPDPSAFFINVGDLLQALTNGRLVSVRHRVVAGTGKPRLSTIYFAAPPLHTRISALPETVTAGAPRRYRAFTWAEYKKTMYTLRLSHNRLDLFHAGDSDAGVGDDDDQE
uniref:gibberellin 2beta-dioxygenase n=1 Tax=Oryza punctata TaxID=4537 RepID=A0A0E0JHZ1_ORYPU